MLLKYTKVSSSGQLANGDWEEFGDDFEYEVDSYEVNKALKKILNQYSKEELVDLVLQFDGETIDLCAFFEDEILDHFREEALRNG